MAKAAPLPDPSSPLDQQTAYETFAAILDGAFDQESVFAFVSGIAERDETSAEIAGAALAMRERMITISAPADAIDVCGTGGDGAHSLNVSTAVAIVAAAAGVPVAKHGNRAASSRAGAADTLEALGLDLDRASDRAEASLNELGICFLFAQKHHPALKPLAAIRKRIGRRTIFNLTGPICNPAGVRRQLIGVARPDYLSTYAGALDRIGCDAAMMVSGDEPLDELSIGGPSSIFRLGGIGFGHERFEPETAGLPRHPLDAIRGGDASYNGAALQRLLDGEAGAYRDAVLLNAAAALIVAGRAGDWRTAVAIGAEAIDSGAAGALLARWIAFA
ncbi:MULTISPECIES: anthranilate phosphoribosyltransferase [unclassified Sphingomonas]|uniref:anthranilate phosphoribosyltransferase n=1 Tax=unclassified Sphingomonas TaxID=196159 RepID=UPI0006FEE3A7|nr:MULTISPECIES: anthranilate phosphoribosyltransferase [unclassified Sphingomonas]KQX25574.1 anthranilate phosphoribosyltransferase [Sphingomonas sp. Root1294]KQY66564.1 anthranilate phosphoribosyltransferase [Sphingomonas sp. Root50]KRB90114.1 anthranilate phosphoribosyltransferase [Sphingomonas sp. Root720]